jgi:hypothetical protein
MLPSSGFDRARHSPATATIAMPAAPTAADFHNVARRCCCRCSSRRRLSILDSGMYAAGYLVKGREGGGGG